MSTNGKNAYSLEWIGRNIEQMRSEIAAVKEAQNETNRRLESMEKAQQRFRVRQAIVETRQNDMTGDLAAIARIIERAGLVDDKA